MDLYASGNLDFRSREQRVAYVGAIDSWFDAELVAAAARALPEWLFELAGPVGSADLSSIGKLPNVRLLGPIPHRSVPRFLQGARVGIIPFKRNNLIDAVHPLKLYEYLAAGLAVVATRWTELERIGAPVALTDSTDQFAQAVVRAAAQGPDPRGIGFAEANDWSERAERLEELIRSLL
jgi:glycosyltransferase involved in cell wall biosynthesis